MMSCNLTQNNATQNNSCGKIMSCYLTQNNAGENKACDMKWCHVI